MSKVIRFPNPDVQKDELTLLTSTITSAVGTLPVQNTADFSVNDYVLIEGVGNEFAEVTKVTAIPTVSSLTVLPTTKFAHDKLAPIRKVLYNKARLYRSTDNVTYTISITQDIDYQDRYNMIIFVDTTGNDSYWYKVEYYNDVSTISKMSDALKTASQIGYISLTDLKTETGFKTDDDILIHALRFTAQNLAIKLYSKRLVQLTGQDTRFQVGTDSWEFADVNLDGIIDKNDFVSWEEDLQTHIKTFVTSDITAIDLDNKIVTFGNPHPTAGRKLVITYAIGPRRLEDMNDKLRRLCLLGATNYVIRNVPFRKLQTGISSWNINNVSVTFDEATLRSVIEANEKEWNQIISETQRIYTKFTAFRQPPMKDMNWIKSTLFPASWWDNP